MKTCCRCLQEKPVAFFVHRLYKGERVPRNYCKQCDAERVRKYKEDNRQIFKQRLFNRALDKYGITEQEYLVILEKQENACAICKNPDPSPNTRFCIDHCHTTGVVRGLLCANCNLGLGFFFDDQERLIQAASYLSVRVAE